MDRLGLGYEALSAVNPAAHLLRGLRASASTGPERATAAFDGKLQAMSGIMSITGEPAHGPTARGVRDLRHDRRPHGGAGRGERALPAHAHRVAGSSSTSPCWTPRSPSSPGPVSEYTVAGIQSAADRQRLGEPQADGEPIPRARRLHRPGGAHREAVREPHADARARRRARRSALQGLAGAHRRTSRRCARSSRTPWRPTRRRAGRRG